MIFHRNVIGAGVLLALAGPLCAPATSQVTQLSGTWNMVPVTNGAARLRVFVAGEGPTIVMLPGQGKGPSALEPLAERLRAVGFRVVLPEPRGYGESVGPMGGLSLRDWSGDVARAIETLGGAPVVMVGQARGNRISRMLAVDRPELVRAIVLLAAGGKFPGTPEATKNQTTFLNLSLPPDERMAAAKIAYFTPQFPPTPEDLMLDGISADTVKAQSADATPIPLEAWWPGGTAPMLIIQGLADLIAPPENGRSLKADYPDRVTLIELPDVGHGAYRVQPDVHADAIVAFIRGLGR